MDAVIAVNCLGLAYMRGDLAHAGFPEHAYPKFADQLIARGYKVARIEQTETPQMLEERNKKKKAGSKDKVVLRELCRITSTATRTFGPLDAADDGEAATQHLISIKEKELNGKPCYGVCYIDTSVGKFTVGQFEDDEYRSALRTLLATSDIAQILLERGNISQQTKSILTGMCCSVPIDHLVPKKQFFVAEDTVKMLQSLDYLGVDVPSWPETIRSMLRTDHVLPEPAVEFDLAWSSLGAIIGHLQRCQIDVDMVTMKDFEMFRPFNDDDKKKENVKASESTMKMKDNWWEGRRVVLDGMTLYNLNIVPSDRSDPIDAAASLYYTVNRCSTPFGKRLLRQWLCAPPCDKTEIELRQDAIEWLLQPENDAFVESTTEILRKIPDLERLLQKIHTLGLKYRAEKHPDSRAILFDTRKINSRKIKDLIMAIDSLKACSDVVRLYGKLEEGCTLMDKCLKGTDISELKEDISNFMKSFDRKQAQEDGFITPVKGSDELYDEAVLKEKAAHDVLDDYRKSVEKQLKCSVKFAGTGKNRLQLEIPTDMKLTNEFELKSRAKKMSKYTTPRLLKLIAELEVAEAEIVKQTNDATRRTFEAFDNKRSTWRIACDGIAIFDVLLSLAKYAKTSGLEMCRPQFDFNAEKPFVSICEGVHPCLANRPLPNANAVAFIPNDTQLGGGAAPILLLTGPNAGGKSTLMRQVATLGVLAHTGSLVPAQSMHLSPVDRIFTRIGASDKIMCGQSTFFVELNETKLILKNATANSLVLFDELGRGTSTFDGTAIASSVLTYLASHISCRGFFSTHYHSICNNIGNNLQIALGHMACIVENENEEDPTEESVTFLYKLTTGICPKSYGFHAAKLASISDEVIRVAYAAARDSISSFTRLEAVRSAARNGVSIDELSKMIAAI
ncbi:hypothetical protein WR25_06496 isoform D [Diploscapter pachys]|uniref:DNA mismatch repair proteins mutS family domain-containing protein n=1 Tax=Diploscapter pachys TaxID=2018661 RepID=A0A2A2J3A9_9BILA|nr:hypothetical protein WR25_06496 isoform A [Diploscapter pachys]PAV56044.1 hypothetical protein WR25_06496 isoform B [Diploscapter pachys]PAV56045.1 hypothetical protein WR25_06496 isoform C [Diploscapter pachys]PAV56046.1 hypothetical protein WR25_06496 isoform D [Diploscapter pachys]